MPSWTPKGVTPGLMQRIRDRVLREKGGPSAPVEGPINAAEPDDNQQLSPGLWNKILDRARDMLKSKGDSKVQRPRAPQNEALDEQTIRFRIHQAGQAGVLLLLNYNSTSRHVEPYSFRTIEPQLSKATKNFPAIYGPPEDVFYGWCRLHNHIEMYKLDKIQGIWVTDEPYSPKFEVEV